MWTFATKCSSRPEWKWYKSHLERGLPHAVEGAGFFTASVLDNASEQKRVPFWREVFGRQAVRLDMNSRSSEPFNAKALVRAMPGLRSTSFVSAAARLERPTNMVADGDDAELVLLLNLERDPSRIAAWSGGIA